MEKPIDETSDSSQEPSQRVARAFWRLDHAYEVYTRLLQSRHNISEHQLSVLHAVHMHGPITGRGITRHTGISASNLVGIITRLESKRWITRTKHPFDRRSIQLTVTEAGLAKLNECPRTWNHLILATLDQIGLEERARLATQMEHFVEILEQELRPAAGREEFIPNPSESPEPLAHQPPLQSS